MKKNVRKKLSWAPRPGRYQCVVPKGAVHIDLYIDDRNPTPAELRLGNEVELYERELRALKTSLILTDGLLAPIAYFKQGAKGFIRDEDGKIMEEPATEDPDNPNIISDDYIYEKVQLVESSTELALDIGGITSELTLQRYKRVCTELDSPLSFLGVIDDQINKVKQAVEDDRNIGEVDERRKELLTEKIKR